MSEYERDPEHPCAHPLYDDSLVEKPVYNPETLTPAQFQWEERRVKRREMIKAKRLAEEEEEFKKNNYQVTKVYKRYAPKNALITPHDFDGISEYCTECDAPLWGTQYVLPLWKKMSPTINSPYLTHPFCEGCYRLFDEKFINTSAQKYEVILWMLTGEAQNLKDDISFDEKYYKIVHKSMKQRANKMRKQLTLYNHEDWKFLKSTKELQFEYESLYPNDTALMIQERINHFIDADPNIEEVKHKPAIEAGIATAEELKSLVQERDGKDALLVPRCYVRFGGAFNGISFDHLEPCSQVQFVDGAYSIGNIQILSRCINLVKGNYTEKELVRWLAKILDTYEERYSKEQ